MLISLPMRRRRRRRRRCDVTFDFNAFFSLMEFMLLCPFRQRLLCSLLVCSVAATRFFECINAHTRCCCCYFSCCLRCFFFFSLRCFSSFRGNSAVFLLLWSREKVRCVEIMKSQLCIESSVSHCCCCFYSFNVCCLSLLRDGNKHNLTCLYPLN